MTNGEKYADIILELAISHNQMAVYNDSKKPAACCDVGCNNCLFMYCGGCGDSYLAAQEWAESEYVEPIKISKSDRLFLDYIKKYKYIAQDFDGRIYAYISKPTKLNNAWVGSTFKSLAGLNIDFPMVKWSDAEPWKIEDLKKLEVCDEY